MNMRTLAMMGMMAGMPGLLGVGVMGGEDLVSRGRDTTLLRAIEQVESRGRRKCVGDNGKAIGILQIHTIMVDDCNRIRRKHNRGKDEFTYSDRSDVEKSRRMFWVYTDHYSRGETREVIARRWNGGPDGDTDPRTAAYWTRVQAAIEAIEGSKR